VHKSFLSAANLLLVTLSLIASLTGCGSPTANVQGKVSYEGSPIQKGMVTFTPADGKGTVVGCSIENGQYSAKGVTPGKNIVTVAATKQVTFSRSSEEMSKMAASNAGKGGIEGLIDPADIVPADAKGNGAEHTVNTGSNTLDLQLTKP
jgi:hypothetical protein